MFFDVFVKNQHIYIYIQASSATKWTSRAWSLTSKMATSTTTWKTFELPVDWLVARDCDWASILACFGL